MYTNNKRSHSENMIICRADLQDSSFLHALFLAGATPGTSSLLVWASACKFLMALRILHWGNMLQREEKP